MEHGQLVQIIKKIYCYTSQCAVMLLHSEFSLFLSEFSACIESILLSLAVLSISWQHFGNFRESSQPEKRGKAETEVGGET